MPVAESGVWSRQMPEGGPLPRGSGVERINLGQ